MAFSTSKEMTYGFSLQSVYDVYYICQRTCVKPSLHLWGEAYLLMLGDLFNVFLDLVWKYFIENFCMCVHEEYWFVIRFVESLYSLGIRAIVAL